MITILRKHHRWLMIVIAILAIPFIFYFNKTDLGANRQVTLGRIYNRTITLTEFSKNAGLMQLAQALGLTLGNDLIINNVQNENDMFADFTWNRLTLRHEAEELGIRPTSSEITEYVKTLPRFKGDSGFDFNKYNEFTTGFPMLESQIEELVSDQLTLDKVKEVVSAGVHVSDSETAENYQRAYGKMDVAVVRFRNEDFAKDVTVTDEDISKYYDAHKAELKSDEKRKVEFVSFTLTSAEKKLTGKERLTPLQKVADKANDFAQALLEKNANFSEVASKFQTPIISTGEFTQATPDPTLSVNPQLSPHAFQLTQQAPFSDPIQGPDGFYVMHLISVTDSHPLTLEEAKSKITDTLKSERVRDLMSKKAAVVAQQLREAAKGTALLETVAQTNGVKLERLPSFALVETTPAPPGKDKDKDKEKGKGETGDDAAANDGSEKDSAVKDSTAKAAEVTDVASQSSPVAESKDIAAKSATPADSLKDVASQDATSEAATKEVKPGDAKSKKKGQKAEVKPAEVKAAEAKKPEPTPKKDSPELQAIKNAVATLNAGDVTDFVPVEKGGLVAVLEKRNPADPAGYAAVKAQYEDQILSQSRSRAFMEWLRDRRRVAGVVPGAG